ncbi:hypothetical protein GCM10007350_28550 [Jeongeupia chitinilytica]|uniref:Uncharacterized protein n=1 Tax=Jeongeupia chitinilytica TaxID=1041641 RepID=A0ABQ3H3L2_9NEIS|nr:hypothetical protein GCM10007350_28550 [Jeongeupia chitinilytica]
MIDSGTFACRMECRLCARSIYPYDFQGKCKITQETGNLKCISDETDFPVLLPEWRRRRSATVRGRIRMRKNEQECGSAGSTEAAEPSKASQN